jgi:uracil-DNA glycosylase
MSNPQGRQALPVILQRLKTAHPDARYELNWETPLQLLVATIMAAQTTDKLVNQVTPALFAKYPDAAAFAAANTTELAEAIRPVAFHRNKAKSIQKTCQLLVQKHGGQVPRSMEEMVQLPGVARKTANVVLTNAFRIPSGVVVDTHVARVSQRLGLTEEDKPEKIETELMNLLPKDEWVFFGSAVVLHGRYTCTARAPKCGECIIEEVCPKKGVTMTDTPKKQTAPQASPARKPEVRKPSGGGADRLPESWQGALAGEVNKPYFQELQKFVQSERQAHTVFPPEEDVFTALKLTPYDQVKVLLLGQDPYHDDGQAHGLCFSVRPGIKPPPSLVNMFKELRDDLGCSVPNNGYLVPWAEQGVLLLNAVLTVRAHEPNSHKDKGWETFTDAVIRAVNSRSSPVVFVLWGAYAQKKEKLIDKRHVILKAAHPSPLSAKKFFGSRPFSAINNALTQMGKTPINWQLPDL